MAEVVLRNVTKKYPPDVVAVNDVTLEVKDKEFLVLVGPSGCGKSTTLRMIAGLEDVTHGEIFIGDRQVNDVAPKDRDIAMVFQNYALYPHMTVYKNLAFGLKLRRFPRVEIDKRVHEAAQILGIGNLLSRKPRALSGGERQRVAVGRAIVRKPQVFLFDEPLSNLDAKMRVQMRAEISKLHSRLQTTMIYVTHDQVEAMTMGDRIVVMKDGLVQQIAEPLELYDRPANLFVAGFIGSPPMNFVHGVIRSTGDDLFFTEGELRVKVPRRFRDRLGRYAAESRPVTFGIRPEDLYDPAFRGEGIPESVSITAKVELIEPMGAELYLYLSIGRSNLIARLDAHVTAEMDELKTLHIDMEKSHFFDADTDKAIV